MPEAITYESGAAAQQTPAYVKSTFFYYVVLLIFLASGAIGLGYQVLWSKFLLEFIGISAYSYATVLAAFMAGLSLGSWWIGSLADRTRSPLKLYAYLELCIAVYALLYIPLSRWLADIYANVVAYSPDNSTLTAGLWAKIVCSAILLLPPTILMGGTFPVLLKAVSTTLSAVGKRASQLYSINALGAVIGTLLMTFLILPFLGLTASLMLLALWNVVLGLIAFLFSGSKRTVERQTETHDYPAPPRLLLSRNQIRIGLLLLLLQGIASFSLEITWTRFFGIVLGSSTYSFSIMLAAFISGISLGSAWFAKFENRIGNLFTFFGWLQVAVASLLVLPLPAYPYLGWFFKQFGNAFSETAAAFYLYEFGKIIFCYLVMLPPTIFLGMAIPLWVKALNGSIEHVGENTGRAYAFNTWGNVFGASLTGLFLLPLLGMEGLFRLNTVLILLLGGAAIYFFHETRNRLRAVGRYAIAGCMVIAYLLVFGSWDRTWFSVVAFRRGSAQTFNETKKATARTQILYFKDDPAAHVMVRRSLDNNTTALCTNAKPDGSNSGDMPTQVLLGHLPLIVKPQSKDVLVIGLATGVTVGAVLKHPVERVDVVDIVKAMSEASRFFTPWNGNPHADRRYRLITDDGRSYVSYAQQKYDVIVSEPSNPWMAGTGSLFSRDFYDRAARALRSDGLFVQWLQGYELSSDTFAAVVRSFRRAFPYIYVFQANAQDTVLIGTRRALQPSWDQMEARVELPAVKTHLQQINISSLFEILFLQRLSPQAAELLAAHTDLENTDDNLFLEYRAPRDLFVRASPVLLDRLDERLSASPSLLWRQSRKSYSDDDMMGVMRLFKDPRYMLDNIMFGAQLAYYLRSGRRPDGFGNALSNNFFVVQKPLTAQEGAERISLLLQSSQSSAAVSLLNTMSTGILISCATTPASLEFWQQKSAEWLTGIKDDETRSTFKKFYLDVLVAGKDARAGEELLKWIRGPMPPAAAYAILRGSQIGADRLRAAIIDYYATRRADPVAFHLQELTQPR